MLITDPCEIKPNMTLFHAMVLDNYATIERMVVLTEPHPCDITSAIKFDSQHIDIDIDGGFGDNTYISFDSKDYIWKGNERTYKGDRMRDHFLNDCGIGKQYNNHRLFTDFHDAKEHVESFFVKMIQTITVSEGHSITLGTIR